MKKKSKPCDQSDFSTLSHLDDNKECNHPLTTMTTKSSKRKATAYHTEEAAHVLSSFLIINVPNELQQRRPSWTLCQINHFHFRLVDKFCMQGKERKRRKLVKKRQKREEKRLTFSVAIQVLLQSRSQHACQLLNLVHSASLHNLSRNKKRGEKRY